MINNAIIKYEKWNVKMKVAPQIYLKDSTEVATFYQKAFGLTLGMTVMNDDGTYQHVSLMCGETEILAIAEQPNRTTYYCDNDPIYINVWDVKTKEAVDHAFEVLREGAYRIDEKPSSPDWDKNK